MTSIHESGLPPPPPKPSQATRVLLSLTSTSTQPQSLLTMGPGTRRPVVSFHDYENYFYIWTFSFNMPNTLARPRTTLLFKNSMFLQLKKRKICISEKTKQIK
jgi:hypothetical protein